MFQIGYKGHLDWKIASAILTLDPLTLSLATNREETTIVPLHQVVAFSSDAKSLLLFLHMTDGSQTVLRLIHEVCHRDCQMNIESERG